MSKISASLRVLSFILLLWKSSAFGTPRDDSVPFVIPTSNRTGNLPERMDYPGPSAVAFDSQNRPYFLHTYRNTHPDDTRSEMLGAITTLRDGNWETLSFGESIQTAMPGSEFNLVPHGLGSIRIDDSDGLYVIAQLRVPAGGIVSALVYSRDLGESFQTYPLQTNDWCGAFLET